MTKLERWLYGLGSAVIGGGAGAVSSSLSAALIAPSQFNLTDHAGNFFKQAGLTFAVSGFMSLMFYLKQSPLPTMNGDTQQFVKPTPPEPPKV